MKKFKIGDEIEVIVPHYTSVKKGGKFIVTSFRGNDPTKLVHAKITRGGWINSKDCILALPKPIKIW